MSQLYLDDGPAFHLVDGQKVMLATVVYEDPDASYTFSIQRSRMALEKAGIATAYLLLSGNCHSDDARNTVFSYFLESDCTDLVFLDADVSWEPKDLVRLCQHDVDLVGGVYPYRRGDVTDRMPVYMIPGVTEPDERGLIEVDGLPAGFLRIRRVVVETLAKDAPTFYTSNESKIPILFERSYKDGTRLGADIHFGLKWQKAGGKVWAMYDVWLGHTGKAITEDSLGAALRRYADETPRWVAEQIRAGVDDPALFRELRHFDPNNFAAREDVLTLATIMARKANGPIFETGSGLTTVCMAAAAPEQMVYCIEHDSLYAAKTERMARMAGTLNIAIVHARLNGDWYEIEDDLPEYFALGLNDGPPRYCGGARMGFFEKGWGDRCETIIVDDTADQAFAEALTGWSKAAGRRIDFIKPRSALIRKQQDQEEKAA